MSSRYEASVGGYAAIGKSGIKQRLLQYLNSVNQS